MSNDVETPAPILHSDQRGAWRHPTPAEFILYLAVRGKLVEQDPN